MSIGPPQATLVASIISVTVALIIFAIQVRTQNRLRRAELILKLEDKYDQICAVRTNNPSLLRTSQGYRRKPYAELTDAERAFHHYCEMVMGFIEKWPSTSAKLTGRCRIGSSKPSWHR